MLWGPDLKCQGLNQLTKSDDANPRPEPQTEMKDVLIQIF